MLYKSRQKSPNRVLLLCMQQIDRKIDSIRVNSIYATQLIHITFKDVVYSIGNLRIDRTNDRI